MAEEPAEPTATHSIPPYELIVGRVLADHWQVRFDPETGAFCECGQGIGGTNMSFRDHVIVELTDALLNRPVPEVQPVGDGDLPLGFEGTPQEWDEPETGPGRSGIEGK